MRCLLHNFVAWLFDCEARVGRGLGVLLLDMNILSSFAVVPRPH